MYFYWKKYPDKQNIFVLTLLFACALLSKENAISFLLLVLVLEFFVFRNIFALILKRYYSLFIVSGFYFLLRMFLKTQISGLEVSNRVTSIISEVIKNIIFSFTAFLFSLNFIAIKEIYKGQNINFINTLLSLIKIYPLSLILILCSIFLFVFLFIKRNKTINFGFIFIFLTILPFIWLTGYERYLYLPSFGFVLILTESFYYLYKKNKIFKVAAIGILSAFIVYNIYNIETREDNWKIASDISINTIENIQKLTSGFPPQSTVYFRNLPDNYNGAWIFRDGIQYIPELVLKRSDIRFSRIFDEDDYKTDLNKNIYIYNYNNGEFIPEK